jgi:hypothetical protein
MKKLKKLELKKVTLQDLDQPQLEQVGRAAVANITTYSRPLTHCLP